MTLFVPSRCDAADRRWALRRGCQPASEGQDMSPKKNTQKSAKTITTIDKKSKGFTDEERAAMKQRTQELRAEARRGPRGKKNKADGESDVLAKITAMPEPERA